MLTWRVFAETVTIIIPFSFICWITLLLLWKTFGYATCIWDGMVIQLLVEFSLYYYLATYKFLHLKMALISHWSKLPSLPTTFDCSSGCKPDIDCLAMTNWPIASVTIPPLAKLELALWKSFLSSKGNSSTALFVD